MSYADTGLPPPPPPPQSPKRGTERVVAALSQETQYGGGGSKRKPRGWALRAFYDRRAKLIEGQMGLSVLEAEREALRMLVCLARGRGYRWADLREALVGASVLAMLPLGEGRVDVLPFGLPRFAMRARGLGGLVVLRQGEFSEPHISRRRTVA